MSDSRTDGEKASVLTTIETAIRNEGCADIAELVARLHDEQANRVKAEEARDKFFNANKEAEKIIGSKGGELGTLNQKIKDLDVVVKDLEGQLESKGIAPVKPVTPITEKPVVDQLAEIEGKMTDKQREQANVMLSAEPDKDIAIGMVEDPIKRLAFLKELTADPTLTERPTSFFKPEEDNKGVTPSGVVSDYERLAALLKVNPLGPSGHAVNHSQRAGLSTRPRGTLVK